ncbi:nicotinate-nucleotide--dimethylbenzimidazole phosphoribosyltransferase [Mycobacteroides chelonae]|uniref:nicotinate-nucleotide--dimethylbenzimidazole phosphoribosyltransferase n=1 Tax=Mycobacteroides chelonae TaxID=1774 RepID=UPI0008A83433|nr:nicotinate-nucleotide--dimethylbenzimidazole phosphoribosyltransferase [Mycobacteroides chelonae]MBF9521045.1 nicotinate-nucleotide--dimethylbenzimidazole phosphoribosyltransferase [Mycobacteroides chelonae]OHU54576.1 nicotinate-nucleotide--dimethylbenzimidazole phosphoribosyltransferase [Mycobacteroides chelonae]PKQ59263.1 nicotinate-nucleotide--dimethylbenzimidazole phosphoribosyltransferase [Mycobacterium sp. MHSD3]SKO03431.1 Probable nicotinate-nucleotide--dimethylbenzimidazole phosphori
MSGGEAPRFAPVSAPNPDIAAAARDRQRQLTKPDGALGRLEELSVWVASCQNRCPPETFQHPRVIVFAGDHGVAAAGVSAYPPSVTAQMVRNIEAGGAAVNVLAALAGASVRVADIAVGRPSGNIAVEDALTEEQAHAALAAGIALADAEIDSGADLLIAGDMGIGNTTPATVLVAALTGSEPVAVVGRGTGVDDAGWARKTAAVRDALRRTKDVRTDPVALLARAGGADLAAITGFVAHAAVRRTPVLLDGLVVTAAALVAEQLAPGARQWWLAGHRSTEPAHSLALQRLRLDPVLDLQMRLGEGSGALVALPVLQAAAGTLAQMATFDEARIDGPGA